MSLTLVIVLILTAATAWWLSGYDSRLSGENNSSDLTRRGLRCGITLILVGFAADQFISGGIVGGVIGVLFLLPLTPFWISCLSELGSRGFSTLVHGEDSRLFDPKQTQRDLDQLAALVRAGCYEEAVPLCKHLLECPDVSGLSIETTLFQIYANTFSESQMATLPQLAEAHVLRAQKRFNEAAAALNVPLQRQPRDLAAALLWMRIQAQDLARADLALGLCQTLRTEPRTPPAFADFAKRCIAEWSGANPPREKSDEGIESLLAPNRRSTPPVGVSVDVASVDELLKAGHLGSAIEALEARTKSQPSDFETWLKLAEAHGVYCRNILRAGKVVAAISNNPLFSKEQVELANARLRDWKSQNGA